MDFYTLFYGSEFAGAAILALLDMVLIVIFLGAYWRIRQGFWLLLVLATVAFFYSNLYAAVINLYGAAHIRLFSPAVMRVFSVVYMVVELSGGIIFFIGMVLSVRFTLKVAGREKTP